MIPTELTFLEVEKEFVFMDSVEFEKAMLGEAPEGFDPVDVVFSPYKFIGMVMNTVMSESTGHQAIVSFPAIGVNVALRKDVSPENGH